MQEGGDHPLLVEAVLGGEVEHVDAAELAIGRLAHQPLDRGNAWASADCRSTLKRASGSLTDRDPAHAE